MEPMVLFEITIVPGVPVPAIIPLNLGAVLEVVCVNVTLPVPVAEPRTLGVIFPILNDPVTAEISDWLADVLELVMAILRMVFP